MPPRKNQSGRGMWPFEGMSLPSAILWGDVANLALLACLVGGVIATFIIVRTANVKEHHWDEAREQSRKEIAAARSDADEKIGVSRADADAKISVARDESRVAIERANADIALARTATAEADARAADALRQAREAQLALEKFKADRALSPRQRAEIAQKMKKFKGQEYFLSIATGAESERFLCILDSVLQAADWKRVEPVGLLRTDTACGPATFNTVSGVSIRASIDAPKIPGGAANAAAELALALTEYGIEAEGANDPKNIPDPKVIAVMVGTKQ